MKNLTVLGLTGLASALIWSGVAPVGAQSLSFDMGEATCGDLETIEDGETAAFLVVWLDGYLSGISEDTVFDTDFLEGFIEDLAEACGDSPDRILVEVAEEVGLE